jgi:beta-ribofuranosylaminobenzene 5'-phosphate synthase
MVKKIVVTTGSRLHFTLIDMNADLGRVDGGIGVALKRPGWKVEISKVRKWTVDRQAEQVVELLKERLSPSSNFKVEVKARMPEHVGLGSRTQLALAIAAGMTAYDRDPPSVPELAKLVGRGGTSGIGVAAFEKGCLILDGGHRYKEKGGFLPSRYSRAGPPPILATYKVPTDWYFVVGIPVGKSYYGTDEAKAFKDHTPIPRKEVGAVARLVLLKLLPALMENDLEAFGEAISSIQTMGFKRIENNLQGPNVIQLQNFMTARGGVGAGLSSFGPACFCVVKGKKNAERLSTDLKRYLKTRGGGKVFFSEAASSGASIKRI